MVKSQIMHKGVVGVSCWFVCSLKTIKTLHISCHCHVCVMFSNTGEILLRTHLIRINIKLPKYTNLKNEYSDVLQ